MSQTIDDKLKRLTVCHRLTDTYKPIRSRAVALLAKDLDKETIDLFDNHLLAEKDYAIRIQMLEALSTKGSPAVVAIVSRYLIDPVIKVRRRAATLLEEIRKYNNRKITK